MASSDLRAFCTPRKTRGVAALAAFVVCFCIPAWVQSPYYLGLMINVIMNGIMALGFIVMLRTGLIHMGLVAFAGLGAYASGLMSTRWGLSFWLTLPLAALICCLVGSGLGCILIGRGRGGLNFVILSTVIGMIFPVVMGSISYVGGQNGITGIPEPGAIDLPGVPALVFGSARSYFYLALLILAVVVLIAQAFYSSWSGRAWKAIGMNPRLAGSVGINVFRYRLIAVAVASAFAGMTGAFTAHYSGVVLPTTFGMWQNVYVQAYAVLGGIGSGILGPLVGAGIMIVVPQMLQFSNLVAPLFMGVVLVLLILFFPGGIMGVVDLRRPLMAKLRAMRRGDGSGQAGGGAGGPPGPAGGGTGGGGPVGGAEPGTDMADTGEAVGDAPSA